MFEVRVEAGFEAGHCCGPDGTEVPLHHHHWSVAVKVRSRDLDHIGIVVDFRVVRSALDETLAVLDQRVLEDLEWFAHTPPTPAAVAERIFTQLDRRLQHVTGGEDRTEPDRSHEFWLHAVAVEADAGTLFEYRPAG